MAINITNLFTNLGKLFNLHKVSETHVKAIPTNFAALTTSYEGTGLSDLITVIPQTQDNYTTNSQTLANTLVTIGQDTIVKVVNADNPQPDTQFLTAFDELVRQMSTTNTVLKNVTGCTITAGTNTGTGVFNYGLKNKYGKVNECLFAESVQIVCTADAQTGGTSVGNEVFLAQGEYENNSTISALFPNKGSGSAQSLTVISAAGDNSLGNLLTDSDFITPTGFWTLTGAGTTIDNSAGAYVGTNALVATGAGTATQTFGDSTAGTAGTLQPNTIYSLSYWTKGVGTVAISLNDGSATITDDASGANILTQAVNSAGAWVNYKATFITPKILPAITKLKIEFSAVTGSVAVDYISLGQMTELYTSGLWLAIHAGATQFYLNDSAIAQTTNTFAGEFQTYFNRFFDLRANGRALPSATSGAETIADSLIS